MAELGTIIKSLLLLQPHIYRAYYELMKQQLSVTSGNEQVYHAFKEIINGDVLQIKKKKKVSFSSS